MTELTNLRAEVERLRSASGAHGVLRSIYLNGELPESLRAKAASAAIQHEVPKLLPERQLELKAQGPERPFEEILAERLARQDELEGLPLEPMPDPDNPGVMRLGHRLPKPNVCI